MLTPRQSFNVFTSIQLTRVKALVAQQTPVALHTLPAAPLPDHARQARSVVAKGERSVRPVKQTFRANRRAYEDLKPSERRRQAYNARYHAAKKQLSLLPEGMES